MLAALATATGATAQTLPDIPPGLNQATPQELEQAVLQQLSRPQSHTRLESLPEAAPAPERAATLSGEPQPLETPAIATPSATETLYRTGYGTPLAADLEQFGYELFARASQRTSRQAVPGPNYVLGPGDEVVVRISGASTDRRVAAVVKPGGALDIPGMGAVNVAGSTLREAQAAVDRLAKGYAHGVEVRLSLAGLRDMEIYVLGEVERPGLTLVPAFGTVLSGLYAAGGVNKSGSLRRIALKRRNRADRTVDLYRLLLSGDRSADVPLKDGDVIFVPRLGPTAAVAGAVRAPGVYELAGEADAAQVLELAGGLLPQGRATHAQLRRYLDGQQFRVREVHAEPATLAATELRPGDMLEVRPVSPEWSPSVRLTGHVRYPDVFAFRPGITLHNVLTGPELLKPGAITDFALLKRYDPATTRESVLTFPLAQVFAGAYDEPLQPQDTIRILSRAEFDISEPVSLRGAVHKPGEYQYTPGMTLLDLLAQAGGLSFGAESGRIELSRTELTGGKAVTHFRTLNLADGRATQLAPFDAVFVPGIKDAERFRYATITGEVRYPGTYRLDKDQPLSALIRRAGGYTDGAYFHGAKFTSPRAKEIQQESIDRLVRELSMFADRAMSEHAQTSLDPGEAATAVQAREGVERLLTTLSEVEAEGRVAIVLTDLPDFGGSQYDFLLADGDELHVPPKPSFVSVVGSVYTPSSFLFRSKAQVRDYLSMAGGTTRNADRKHMYVLKANGEVTSADQPGNGRGKFLNQTLMPGDTLVVPEDFERVPYLRLFVGISDILFKIATTAGIALAAL